MSFELITQYPHMVKTLFKPAESLLSELTQHKVDCMHAVAGVCGESGELLDAVKKYWAYNKPLDRENLIEELGDIEFYLEALRQKCSVTREQTLEANMAKLAKRYEGFQYTNAAAIFRADKQS